VRFAKPRVEVIVDRPVLVAIEDAVGRAFVLVTLLCESAVDRERSPPALYVCGAVDAVRSVQEGDVPAPEVEAGSKDPVRKLWAMLRL
jgi:hypothetical protein